MESFGISKTNRRWLTFFAFIGRKNGNRTYKNHSFWMHEESKNRAAKKLKQVNPLDGRLGKYMVEINILHLPQKLVSKVCNWKEIFMFSIGFESVETKNVLY